MMLSTFFFQSISFHESGKKHQENAAKRLQDIHKNQSFKDRKDAKEAEWIAQMERNAMKDYRTKDLEGGHDLSARIFHERKKEKDAIEEQIREAKAREAEIKARLTKESRDEERKPV